MPKSVLRYVCVLMILASMVGIFHFYSEHPSKSEKIPVIDASLDKNANKIDDRLEGILNSTEIVNIVVLLNRAPDPWLLREFHSLGGVVRAVWTNVIWGFAGSLPRQSISKLATFAPVVLIQPENTFYPQTTYSTRQILARPFVWNLGYTGDPQTSIAIIDTGLDDSHPALAGKVIGWRDFINNLSSPYDDNGHGTFCASIAAGSNFNTTDELGSTLITFNVNITLQFVKINYVRMTSFNVSRPGKLLIEFKWYSISGDVANISLYRGNTRERSTSWTFVTFNSTPSQNVTYLLSSDVNASTVGTYHFYVNFSYPPGTWSTEVCMLAKIHCPTSDPDGYGGFKGVAPDVKLVGAKIANASGETNTSAILSALEWIVSNKNVYNITTALLSFSGPIDAAVDNAVNNVVGEGIVVVVPIGRGIESPGRAVKAITVGAMNMFDQVDSTGYITTNTIKPDLVAPGGSEMPILAADTNDVENWWNSSDETYNDTLTTASFFWNTQYEATSVSAAHVAGAVALLIHSLGGISSWTWSEESALKVKQLLLMTASETWPLNTAGNIKSVPLDRGKKDICEGYGRLNVDAAVNATTVHIPLGGTFSSNLTSAATLLPFLPTTFAPPFEPRVAAARVTLSAGHTYLFSLTVPSTGDFDLFIYNASPDWRGEPIIVANSTTDGQGVHEYIAFSAPRDGDYYVVVKAVNGSGQFSLQFTEASTLPEVRIVSPSYGSLIYNHSFNITVYTSSPPSSVRIILDDVYSYTATQENATYWYLTLDGSSIRMGPHTIRAVANHNGNLIYSNVVDIIRVEKLNFTDNAETEKGWLIDERPATIAWCGNLNTASYGNNWNEILTMKDTFSIPSNSQAYIRISSKFIVPYPDNDIGYIELWNGSHWEVISTYTCDQSMNSYITDFYDISKYNGSSGLKIRLRFESDSSGTSIGWMIDYIDVANLPWCTSNTTWFSDDFCNLTQWEATTNWHTLVLVDKWHRIPSTAHSGSYSLIAGENFTHTLDIFETSCYALTGYFEITDMQALKLSFWCYFPNAYMIPPNHLYVECSSNLGATWILLEDIDSNSISGQWVYKEYNLPSSAVRNILLVRFIACVVSSSFHLDDISITGIGDNTPPLVSGWVSGNYTSGDTTYASENSVFYMSGVDPESGISKLEYSIDSNDWNNYISPVSLHDLNEGTHTIRYRATNGKGMTTESSLSIAMDKTSPSIELLLPVEGAHLSNIVNISWNATDGGTITSGISSVRIYYGATSSGPWILISHTNNIGTYEWNVSSIPDGEYYLFINCTDNVGHGASCVPRKVNINNKAPALNISMPSLATGLVLINWTATDGNGIAHVSLYYGSSPSGPWTPIAINISNNGSVMWNSTATWDGEWYIKVEASDGFRIGEAIKKILVDNTAPQMNLTISLVGEIVRIEWNVIDFNGTGVAFIELYYSTSPTGPWTKIITMSSGNFYEWSIASLPPGTYYIMIYCVDYAGHSTTEVRELKIEGKKGEQIGLPLEYILLIMIIGIAVSVSIIIARRVHGRKNRILDRN